MNAPVSIKLKKHARDMNKDRHLIRDRNLAVLFCVTLIVVMGVSSIAPAFPKISQALGISKKETALLITVFTFPGIFLSPFIGVLSDRVGRKKLLVPSLFLFALSGASCALTANFSLLLALRFFQGVGAAALGSLNLTIIGDIYSGEKRIRALGYNSTVLSIGAATYPSLGGAIALLGWNFPFLLSLFAVPVGIAVLCVLKNPEPKMDEHIFDYLKNTMKGVKEPRIYILFAGTLATFILLYGVIFSFFPFYFKEQFNAGPLAIGLLISSISVGTMIGSFNLGRLSETFSSRLLILAGFLMYSFAIVSAMLVSNFVFLALPFFLYGFANGINIPSTQALLAERIPMEYRGAFMSINSTVLRVGQTVGPMLTGAALVFGNSAVFYASALFSFLVFVFLGLGLSD